ncbi:MAG: glycosyltransferase, partial [Deltaproteobacteria bacterium]|nr:glycosyltransferase [Deltaproteobacteria bacterium]
MKQRKVLYVSPNAKKAGAEQLTALIARFHDRSRWVPEFYFFGEGPFVDELRALKITCHTSHYAKPPRLRNPVSVWQRVHELRDRIRANDIQLVHSIMGYGHLFGGLAARAARVPEVWYQHGPTGELDWLTGLVPTSEIFVNSQHTLQAQTRYRARTKKMKVVLPGIDVTEAMRNSPAKLAATQRITIGLFGRISPMKGHGLLLAAVARLKQAGISLTCVFSGEPFSPGDQQYAHALREQVKQLGLEKEVVFAGFVREVTALMASCQIVVNCSVTPEPFGLTVVEAMSLG